MSLCKRHHGRKTAEIARQDSNGKGKERTNYRLKEERETAHDRLYEMEISESSIHRN